MSINELTDKICNLPHFSNTINFLVKLSHNQSVYMLSLTSGVQELTLAIHMDALKDTYYPDLVILKINEFIQNVD